MRGIPVTLAARDFESNVERLTNQELRILQHMLKADSAKEAAWQLGIAVSTAKNLRSRVLQKMMAENTPSLLLIAALARRDRPGGGQ